jgi:RNase P/RNase MRP subunit POP5
MKLKIKPSAKIKRHYLLLDAKSKKEVESVILDYIGILGWAKASPRWILKGNKLILAVERKAVTNVRAAFELSQKNIKVLKVSGTLKGLNVK